MNNYSQKDLDDTLEDIRNGKFSDEINKPEKISWEDGADEISIDDRGVR